MTQPKPNHPAFVARMLIAIGLIALALIAWHLRDLLLLIFGAVLVAVILRLIARPIHERLALREGLALAVAVLLVVLLFAAAFWLFGAEVGRQTHTLGDAIPAAWKSLQLRLEALGVSEQVSRWMNSVGSGEGILPNIGRILMRVGNGVVDLLLVLVGGVYLAAQPDLYRTGLLKLVPPDGRPLATDALDESGKTLGLWLKGRLVSMAIVGLLTGIGLSLIGVPSALTLALLSAILEFIPFLGPILAAIPAILIALAFSPEGALWTALLYFGVQQIEGYVVEPLVQQQAVTIPPAVLLFALFAAGLLFGTAGILLGAPLTVVLFVLVKRLYVREALHTRTPMPADKRR